MPCKSRATVSETAPSPEDLLSFRLGGPAHCPTDSSLETDSAAYVTLKTNLGEVGYAILLELSQARARSEAATANTDATPPARKSRIRPRRADHFAPRINSFGLTFTIGRGNDSEH